TVSPSNPASAREVILSAGQRPVESTSPAWRARTPRATTSALAGQGFFSSAFVTGGVLLAPCWLSRGMSDRPSGASLPGFTAITAGRTTALRARRPLRQPGASLESGRATDQCYPE